ncbi:MAG TPA: hypothetical protein VNF47_26555 [Streptosporangiaceae bacterium]|nr:hypothetical protein [Streptosporangiaceae bacterium]
MTATLGDLLNRASEPLSEAASIRDLPSSTVVVASMRLRTVVEAMSRYVANPHAYPESSAAARASARMFRASRNLARAAEAGRNLPGPGAAHPLPARIETSVPALIAGLDMLATHYTTDTDGWVLPRSPWADVLAVPATRTALLAEVADMAAIIGAACRALAGVPSPALPQASREALRAAGSQLRALLPGPAGEPEYRQLVRAVPAAMAAPRQTPDQPEPVVELCEGITASAERIRSLTWRPAPGSLWPPSPSLSAWRWSGHACAITGRISEQILAGLAERSSALGLMSTGPALSYAAIAAGTAWNAWRHTASMAALLTEAVPWEAPGALRDDLDDLMIRLGRLAYANPMWTPAASQRAPLKDLAELAPGAGDLRIVLAAVHQATDSLDRVATADLNSVRSADPRQIVPQVAAQVPASAAELVRMYEMTSHAMGRAAAAVGVPAAAAGTQSSFLSVMREVHRAAAEATPDRQRDRLLTAIQDKPPGVGPALWRASFPGQLPSAPHAEEPARQPERARPSPNRATRLTASTQTHR